jgi:hypothetical protein
MGLALSIFGVTFAALCVWLTVRIINRRERWAKWTLAAVIGLPVLYAASFGPACWWLFPSRKMAAAAGDGKVLAMIRKPVPAIYLPVLWFHQCAPDPVADAIASYAAFGLGSFEFVELPRHQRR